LRPSVIDHYSFDVRTSFGPIWHMRAHSAAGATLGLMHTSWLRRWWSAPIHCHPAMGTLDHGIRVSAAARAYRVRSNTTQQTPHLKLNEPHRAKAGTRMEAGGERAGSGHRSTERDERERRQQSDPSVEGRQAGHRGASLASHLRRSSQSGVGVWNMRVLHHSSADGSATARVTSK
jgi:hypothetical protein